MNPNDILGDMQDLERILGETANSATLIEQPRMKYEEPVKTKPVQNDDGSPMGQTDSGHNDPRSPEPMGLPQPTYSPTISPISQFTRSDTLSRREEELIKYALGVMISDYHAAIQDNWDEETCFIRTDIQYFVQERGRGNFDFITNQTVQGFIDECVNSTNVLDERTYHREKILRGVTNNVLPVMDNLTKVVIAEDQFRDNYLTDESYDDNNN